METGAGTYLAYNDISPVTRPSASKPLKLDGVAVASDSFSAKTAQCENVQSLLSYSISAVVIPLKISDKSSFASGFSVLNVFQAEFSNVLSLIIGFLAVTFHSFRTLLSLLAYTKTSVSPSPTAVMRPSAATVTTSSLPLANSTSLIVTSSGSMVYSSKRENPV